MIVLFFSTIASAKLPPSDFAADRLESNRLPSAAKIEFTLFRKSPKEYQGTLELFSDASFKAGNLTVARDASDTGFRMLAVALTSTKLFSDIIKYLGPLDSETQSVRVIDDTLVHRYGNNPSLAVDADSGALVELRTKRKDGPWRLVMKEDGKTLKGSVYRSGVIYIRFKVSR